GNAQHLSGAAEMQLLGDGDEIAQVAQFHKGSMSRKTYRSCRILYWIEISILLILVTIPTTKTVLAPADPCVTAAFCPKKYAHEVPHAPIRSPRSQGLRPCRRGACPWPPDSGSRLHREGHPRLSAHPPGHVLRR